MSKVIFVLILAVILALCYIALENPVDVQLKLLGREPLTLPLYAVLFGGVGVGALFVYVLFLLHGVRHLFLGWRKGRIKKRDERTDDYRQRSRRAFRLGDTENAKALLERAIHLSPDNFELFLDLADVFIAREQYAQASDHYHRVFSRDPQNIRAILGIAQSNEGSGNFSEAELYYRRVLAFEKTNPVALRGLLTVQRAQQKWDDAMETLRLLRRDDFLSSEEFDKKLAILWYERGMAEKKAGDLKTSISSLEKSLKAQQEFLPSLLSLGEAYIREDSPDRAVKLWEGALTDHFEFPLARALENHMIQHGGEKDLLQFYKKVANRSELARLLLARLYVKQNRIEEAEVEINRIPEVEASPGGLMILAEIEKKRMNEALSNRHYALAADLLHRRLDKYHCGDCGSPHHEWVPQCRKCGAWNTLKIDAFLV